MGERISEIDSDGETGYILEVDVDYPSDLHNLHNDLPFLPEKFRCGQTEKLVATLLPKEKYVVHLKNLQQAMKHGVVLKKIHRVLAFHQSAWMAPYIELNNKRRAEYTSKSKRDLCKLMNNAVFGKTIENITKRRKIYLCSTWENIGKKRGASFYISSGQLKRVVQFSENFVACEMNKTSLIFDKPIQVGFTILELSKLTMYDFHYETFPSIYPVDKDSPTKKTQLCYMDTDSFIYHVHTKDFYADIKELVNTGSIFDTSNYPINNPYGFCLRNKQTLGAWKDECSGEVMVSFTGLRAKCYSFSCLSGEVHNKAKGTKKAVTKTLAVDDYIRCFLDPELRIVKNQHTIRSHHHNLVTENVNKVALNGKDDKRYLLKDRPDTLALGHFLIEGLDEDLSILADLEENVHILADLEENADAV